MPKESATEKKKEVEKKVEEKVKAKTKTIVKRVVIDTSALLSSIAESLGKFDKDSQKEFLIKLRSDIDKLLSKYSYGGMTMGATQGYNITQSNMSSSSVNSTMFGGGGGVGNRRRLSTKQDWIEKFNNDYEEQRKNYSVDEIAYLYDLGERNGRSEEEMKKDFVEWKLRILTNKGGSRFDEGGGVEMSEEKAKKELELLKKDGKITLSVGNHGLIFMQIVKTDRAMVSSLMQSYESYLDAYRHYLRTIYRFSEGGGVSSDQRRKGYVHGYKFDNPNDRETFTNYLEREDIDYYTRNGVVATKMAISNKELRKIGISQEFSEFGKGGGVEGRKRDKYNKLIGRRDNDFYFLDDIFHHEDGFKGATGSVVVPVNKTYYDYATSYDGILERYMDAMGEDEWLDTLGYQREDFEDEDEMISAIEDGIWQTYLNGGLEPFEQVSYELEEQMRELPEFSDSDEYPLFETIGGGRIFDKDTKFDEIYDQELYNKIREVEEFKRGGGVYNRSWHQDHNRHNKREKYEVSVSSRKKAHGGTIEERMRMRRGM